LTHTLLGKFIFPLLVFQIGTAKAQSVDENAALLWFDQKIGKENAGVFNGGVYINTYRLNNDTHPYFHENNFSQGWVEYDAQRWSAVQLKYDTHRNELILQSEGNYSYMAISLSSEKTSAFSIYDRNFVNLKLRHNNLPEFINSVYYEEVSIVPNVMLYASHHKSSREKIQDGRVYDTFSVKNTYALLKNGEFYPVNSKREIVLLFPDRKRVINDFYQLHRKKAKTNPQEFLIELLRFIHKSENNI